MNKQNKKIFNSYLLRLLSSDFNVKAYKKGFILIENKKQDLKLCFNDNECSFYNFDYENIINFKISYSRLNKILKSNKDINFKIKVLKGRETKEHYNHLKHNLKYFLKKLIKKNTKLKQKYIAYVDNYNININTNVLQYKYKSIYNNNSDTYSIFIHKSKNTVYLFLCSGNDENLKIMYRLNISRFLYLKAIQDLIASLDIKVS